MGVDGRIDLRTLSPELAITRARPLCEELLLERGENLPVGVQCIDVTVGDATQQVRCNVVQVFLEEDRKSVV